MATSSDSVLHLENRNKSFICNICLFEKSFHPKLLTEKFGIYQFYERNREPGLPSLILNSKICGKCYQKACYDYTKNQKVKNNVKEFGQVMVQTVGKTRRFCCVCGKTESPMQDMTATLAATIWVEKRIMVPIVNNRLCTLHIHRGKLNKESLTLLKKRSGTVPMDLTEKSKFFEDILISLVQQLTEKEKKPTLDFDSDEMTRSDYESYTGLNKEQFDDLVATIGDSLIGSCNRSKRNALGIFLCKLRMDLSQVQIAHLFDVEQPRVSDVFHRVADILNEKFASKFLGYSHISRDAFRGHSRKLANALFDPEEKARMYILDGTYLEIESSTNFEFQKDTYSPHKHYNLVKPMIVCAPDGYILPAEGLFYANNNDATILNKMLEDGSPFSRFVEEQDILIVDRGFRDSKGILEAKNLEMVMPKLLTGGKKQFESIEANESRLVTMLRWVVEAINGRIKNVFKFLRNLISNKYLADGFLMKILNIVCAIFNKYFPTIAPDHPCDLELAIKVKIRAQNRNELQELVIEKGWMQSRTEFVPIDQFDVTDFPVLSVKDLQTIGMGSYQVKIARSYTAIHVKDDEFKFRVHREMFNIIRVQMESRFQSRVTHTLWIRYSLDGYGPERITGWFCKCQVGARVVGCCAHIMAVLWYLSIGRHNDNLKFPAESVGASIYDARIKRRRVLAPILNVDARDDVNG